MEIRFTASIALATGAMISLMRGTLGMRGNNAPRPDWCTIPFFSKITASPIHKYGRIEPKKGEHVGSWELERRVAFYHRGVQVALVFLHGRQLDGVGELDDCSTFWGVVQVQYARSFTYAPDVAREWTTVELSGSLTAGSV